MLLRLADGIDDEPVIQRDRPLGISCGKTFRSNRALSYRQLFDDYTQEMASKVDFIENRIQEQHGAHPIEKGNVWHWLHELVSDMCVRVRDEMILYGNYGIWCIMMLTCQGVDILTLILISS
jgi:hypothetical protein